MATLAGTRLAGIAILIILGLSAAHAQAQAEKRVALVIGNGAYATAPLKNPVNDARDIAAALRSVGFDVIHRENIDRTEMRRAVRDFSRQIRQGGVGLFYFAGHGVQVNGRNYLIPVGSNIEEEFEVADEGLDASSVLRAMEAADNRLNIVILDACRNNPFARSFRSADRGLARMAAPTGSLVAYATAPGQVAADGDGRNGVFTKHLLDAMQDSGRTLEQVFKQVRIMVERETSGRQIPWEESSLTGDFYFTPGAGAVATPNLAPALSADAQREQLVWQGIAGSQRAADFEQFLRDFPDGNFAGYARNRLTALTKPAATSGGAGAVASLPVATEAPQARIVLTGHGELKKRHGAITADQHYDYVAASIVNYLSGRNLQVNNEGVLTGGKARLSDRLGGLQSPGNSMLYLTVVGATTPFGFGRDVVTLECYSADGKLQWSQEEKNFDAKTREESLGKAADKLALSLESRLGSECLR